MKWQFKCDVEFYKNKKRCEEGDTYRVVEKFLLFPKTLGTTTKWICKAKIKQELCRGWLPRSKPFWWADIEWVEGAKDD